MQRANDRRQAAGAAWPRRGRARARLTQAWRALPMWAALLAVWASAGCSPASTPSTSGTPQDYSDIPVRSADVGGLPEPADLALEASAALSGASGQFQAALRLQGPWSGQLVVVLPDAGGDPANYKEFLREAARSNHHAVAVPGWPKAPLTQTCGANPACYDAARAELWDGLEHTDKLTIAASDAWGPRLRAGLEALEKAHPGQNWGSFYAGSQVLWAKVRLVGHGEGASQAAWVAKKLALSRVVLLAGPIDGSAQQLAAWVNNGRPQNGTAWYALSHTADPQWSLISLSWTALGLGAGALSWPSVDQGAVFGVAVMTTAAPTSDPRNAIAVDAALARDGLGRPALRLTWRNLVGQ